MVAAPVTVNVAFCPINTVPVPVIPPVELRVTALVTVSVVLALGDNVSDVVPLIVTLLTVVLASSSGPVAVVGITTSSVLAGTPDRLQLPAVNQSLEVAPVQVFVVTPVS